MAIKSIQYRQKSFQIAYEVLNPEQKRLIIFLHGWGSNKELMKGAFGAYLDTYKHIYIDLPGFGGSTCSAPLVTEDYANILELFLAQINANHDPIIVGHSFGGKVATRLAPPLLVLLGSSGILVPKPLKIKLKIALTKLGNKLGFGAIGALFRADDAKALSETMYKTFKNVVNEEFSDSFRTFRHKALLCWGKDDTATPLYTAEEINELIADSRLAVFEGDHYFFMQHAEGVAKEIEQSILEMHQH